MEDCVDDLAKGQTLAEPPPRPPAKRRSETADTAKRSRSTKKRRTVARTETPTGASDIDTVDLFSLPVEIVLCVLSHCAAVDVARVGLTCRWAAAVVADPVSMAALYRRAVGPLCTNPLCMGRFGDVVDDDYFAAADPAPLNVVRLADCATVECEIDDIDDLDDNDHENDNGNNDDNCDGGGGHDNTNRDSVYGQHDDTGLFGWSGDDQDKDCAPERDLGAADSDNDQSERTDNDKSNNNNNDDDNSDENEGDQGGFDSLCGHRESDIADATAEDCLRENAGGGRLGGTRVHGGWRSSKPSCRVRHMACRPVWCPPSASAGAIRARRAGAAWAPPRSASPSTSLCGVAATCRRRSPPPSDHCARWLWPTRSPTPCRRRFRMAPPLPYVPAVAKSATAHARPRRSDDRVPAMRRRWLGLLARWPSRRAGTCCAYLVPDRRGRAHRGALGAGLGGRRLAQRRSLSPDGWCSVCGARVARRRCACSRRARVSRPRGRPGHGDDLDDRRRRHGRRPGGTGRARDAVVHHHGRRRTRPHHAVR
ncbi:F-box domain protein [Pandoravirus inopinatum]|uniref:F-box domain protein n=1 Tax=Pandoravirus inopinatum TaxID=1605721 RepID=A0A0B5J5B0_9VIRU|nr:F-box domain protein [Pandoravirus inopinatum]AJF96825.1 F-box domain protein [Pandoravirus inopinatum]